MKKSIFFSSLVFIAFGIITGCNKDNLPPETPEGTFFGPTRLLGNGQVRSYVTLDQDGNPLEIGFNFSADMLHGLPTDTGMGNMIMLELPPQATGMGYDHLEIDWNPHGHDPLPIYGLPHFDFHFYLVGMDVLSQVIPGPDTIPVLAQFVPKDYVSGIFAVPYMGVHWSDTLSPEFHGHVFTSTFIYGFYHGQMYFVEPMVTKVFLQTKSDVSFPVKQPEQFQKEAYYPMTYSIHFDANKKQYSIALKDLVKHGS